MRFVRLTLLGLLLLIGVDRLFGWAASGSFIPARKLASALSASPAQVLVAGDSRMVAALDRDAFQTSWLASSGQPAMIADVTLGGVSLAAQAIAVRRYFEQGGKAAILLLGTVPETLRDQPVDPERWIGNEAVTLWWSHLEDGAIHFGGRPLNPETADHWFRFVVFRTSTLGALRSLLWIRAQRAQDALVHGMPKGGNRFGEVREMRALAERWRQEALHDSGSGDWPLDRWACELRRTTETNGARLVIAELPMPSTYDEVRLSPRGRRIRARLVSDFCGEPVEWVDAAHVNGIGDEDFEDGLHLGKHGARLISSVLGREVSSRLRPAAAK